MIGYLNANYLGISILWYSFNLTKVLKGDRPPSVFSHILFLDLFSLSLIWKSIICNNLGKTEQTLKMSTVIISLQPTYTITRISRCQLMPTFIYRLNIKEKLIV